MRVGVHDDPTIAFCKAHDIVYQAYSPLGHGTNTTAPPVLLLPQLKEIAVGHNVSAAQVAFRFLTQVRPHYVHYLALIIGASVWLVFSDATIIIERSLLVFCHH